MLQDAPSSELQEMRERFHNALISVTSDRDRPTIGTISEKTVHAVIKNYIEPNEDKQEIPIGSNVADIYTGDEIFEIQTQNLKDLLINLTLFFHSIKLLWFIPLSGKRKSTG